jgi:hypothetical protein
MHTKLHDLVKPLLLALVLGLLSGCGGSSSNDDGATSQFNTTIPNTTIPVYGYDFPVNVARNSDYFLKLPELSQLPGLPDLSALLGNVDRSQYTITYTGISESDKNKFIGDLKYFIGGNGLFTLSGLKYGTYYINEAAAQVQYNSKNGLYDITLSVTLDGRKDISGSGFFKEVFADINAQVSSISNTYYYDQKKLWGLIPIPEVPPMYLAYKKLLTTEGFTNNSLLTVIPLLPDIISVHAASSLYKTVGDFKYEWSYTSQILGFYGSSSTWIISRVSTI